MPSPHVATIPMLQTSFLELHISATVCVTVTCSTSYVWQDPLPVWRFHAIIGYDGEYTASLRHGWMSLRYTMQSYYAEGRQSSCMSCSERLAQVFVVQPP